MFVAGLSMGGLLATKLAIEHGPRVAGLMLVNPVFAHDNRLLPLLPALRHVVPSVPGGSPRHQEAGRATRAGIRPQPPPGDALADASCGPRSSRDLPEVTQPVLLLHSREDHVVPPIELGAMLSRISSSDVTEIWLEDSFHVATLDNDAPLIHDESVRFIERLTAREG